jgi:hypothetical protein
MSRQAVARMWGTSCDSIKEGSARWRAIGSPWGGGGGDKGGEVERMWVQLQEEEVMVQVVQVVQVVEEEGE